MAEEFSRSDEDRLEKALKAAALENHPNPNRIGCPADKTILRRLAAKKLRPSDPLIQHVAECSPCLVEVLQYRTNLKRKKTIPKVAAIAAMILVIATALFWMRKSGVSQVEQVATIDLRPFTVSRGEEASRSPQQPALTLDRGKLILTVLLPVGAEEGPYEFKLLNDSLQTVRSGTGKASIRNNVTTISTKLETSGLSQGLYSFWLRQPGQDWRSYRVKLQ